MNRTSLFLVVVGLTGCVATTQPQSKFTPLTEPTPTCKEQRECEAMWIEASDAISRIGGMRVATQTDSVIETYNSVRSGTLRGRAVKAPLPDGGYAIRVSFGCPQHGCQSLINPATDLFNLRVNSAGLPFRKAPNNDKSEK